jgi:hypothetical protein
VEFGSYASAVWPPVVSADGNYSFTLNLSTICTDVRSTTTDGKNCGGNSPHTVQVKDKITAHIRMGFTLHILNSTRVHTQHSSIHGAPGFAITEYDGYGQHSYFNVSVGRRHEFNATPPPSGTSPHGATAAALCGTSNPTGGRLCLGLISSNNDALHSSGCKYGPSFASGELSYCLDDWVNVHSRGQVVFQRLGVRRLVMIDPRAKSAATVHDNFAYGNAETLVSDNTSFM